MQLRARKNDDATGRGQQTNVWLQRHRLQSFWLRARVCFDLLGGIEPIFLIPSLIVINVRTIAKTLRPIRGMEGHAVIPGESPKGGTQQQMKQRGTRTQ